MAISENTLKLLFLEAKRLPFRGSLLTLGRQDVLFTLRRLQEIARSYQVELKSIPTPDSDKYKPVDTECRDRGYINDDLLFECMGFSSVESLDFSDYESPTHIFDMNGSDAPEHLKGKYDVIINGGTIEHIFHVPNALCNIHRMLAAGGKIIHFAPTSNYIDHGFYMFSPTFFMDYYQANRYGINTLKLVKRSVFPNASWTVLKYDPEKMGYLSVGGFDKGPYLTFFIATKNEESTCGDIPSQSEYARVWQKKTDGAAKRGVVKQCLINILKRNPRVFYWVNDIYRKYIAKKLFRLDIERKL